MFVAPLTFIDVSATFFLHRCVVGVTYHSRNDLLRLVDEGHDGSSVANASDTFDGGIEGAIRLHVRDDDRLESILAIFAAEHLVEPLALLLGAD